MFYLRETPADAGYIVVRYCPELEGYILRDIIAGSYELWVKRPGFAGYAILLGRTELEFVRTLKENEIWDRLHGQARFWVYSYPGWVRIKLNPGQSLEHVTGGPTDEGYSYTATTWEHCGDHIEMNADWSARDCDGRASSNTDYYCPLDKLEAGESGDGEYRTPDWTIGKTRCYDQYAEMMNY